jgi:hypothetical protein
MTKLFKFSDSANSKEIGYHPQLRGTWTGPTDYWAPNSFANTPVEGRIDFNIIFPKFDLENKAKLTDRVSTGSLTGDYFIVSERLLDLLEGFKMDEYQYFPIDINTPSISVRYMIIYFPFPRDNNFINWEESIFDRELPTGDKIHERFANAQKYLLAKDGHQLKDNNLIINYEEISSVDIFRFKWYKLGFYVSERLKNAIDHNGITGVRFEEAEWFIENS